MFNIIPFYLINTFKNQLILTYFIRLMIISHLYFVFWTDNNISTLFDISKKKNIYLNYIVIILFLFKISHY